MTVDTPRTTDAREGGWARRSAAPGVRLVDAARRSRSAALGDRTRRGHCGIDRGRRQLQERHLAPRHRLPAGHRHLPCAPAAGGDGLGAARPACRRRHGSRQARIASMLAVVRDLPHDASVADPFTAPGSLSQDGRTAYSTVSLDVAVADMPVEDVRTIIQRAQDFARPGLQGGRWRAGTVRGGQRGWRLRGCGHPGRTGDPGVPVRFVARGNSSAVDRRLRGRRHGRPADPRIAPVHRAQLHRAGDAGRSRGGHGLRVADLLPLSP